MTKHLRLFLQTAVTLVILQITAQPAFVSEVRTDPRTFATIGNIYFTSGNSLWRTEGTAGATIILKCFSVRTPGSFTEFNDIIILTTSASELWLGNGTIRPLSGVPPIQVNVETIIGKVSFAIGFGNARLAGSQKQCARLASIEMKVMFNV